jgi:glycosyltransferase involved in cell wall biosynthesis
MTGESPLRVLHVIDALGMGGAETWLMEALRLWSKSGQGRFDFLVTSGERGIFDDEARQLGAKIHYVRYGRTRLAQFISEFRQILRSGQYHAIHDHQDYASGWHFLMGAGVLPPVRVTHVHNPWIHIAVNYEINLSRRLTTIAGKRFVSRFATHVCGTSEAILRQYGFMPGHTKRPAISVVHCGIDVGKFNASREHDRESVLREFGWGQQAKVVLFAGRLDAALEFDHPQNHKNSWFALNVLRVALEREPSVRLLMAGAGDDSRKELNRHIQNWGLQNKLRLIGIRKDIPRLMRAADMLFFPSREEGLGMVAVEAQAAGLPVLVSDAVPREAIVIPELVTSLRLSAPIGHWADVLLETLSTPRKPAEAYRSAMQASDFSIDKSVGNLLRLYTGTCGSRGFAA